MSATKLAFAVVIATLAAAGVRGQPKAPPRACIFTRNINGFTAPNDRTVLVRVGVKDIYRLDLMSDCVGISFDHRLALESSPGQSWICSPLEATVISGRNGMHQRCPVTAIHQLTPAEAAALPKRDRP